VGRLGLQWATRRDPSTRSLRQELHPDQSPSASTPERGGTGQEPDKKSKVRAKVEYVMLVLKRIFGFSKIRYRGLAKNTNWLFVTCGLANLYLSRRHVLRVA
jgi:IS5 family transposase